MAFRGASMLSTFKFRVEWSQGPRVTLLAETGLELLLEGNSVVGTRTWPGMWGRSEEMKRVWLDAGERTWRTDTGAGFV